VKRLALILAVGALAGCGGSSRTTSTTTTTTTTTASPPVPSALAAMRALVASQPALAGKLTKLYEGGPWAVIESASGGRAHAVVLRLAGNTWHEESSRGVKITILGPQPGATVAKIPQIAIGFTSTGAPFVESALWVDGKELLEKGGGTPTDGDIFGAPTAALKPGMHVAVGYARSDKSGAAVAWVFRVK
jgi:hypothetical protein